MKNGFEYETISGIDLDNDEICNAVDLCIERGIDPSTFRKHIHLFENKKGSIRKLGGVWVVLRSEFDEVMANVKPRKKRIVKS